MVHCHRHHSSSTLSHLNRERERANVHIYHPTLNKASCILYLVWVVFTTAILHWHNILQHIRVNIRAVVEFTNAADENSRRK